MWKVSGYTPAPVGLCLVGDRRRCEFLICVFFNNLNFIDYFFFFPAAWFWQVYGTLSSLDLLFYQIYWNQEIDFKVRRTYVSYAFLDDVISRIIFLGSHLKCNIWFIGSPGNSLLLSPSLLSSQSLLFHNFFPSHKCFKK